MTIMPRKTGEWKKQDNVNWIILDKIVRNGPQNLPSLEGLKGGIKLSHASVRIGVEQLQKKYIIQQTSVDQSIPRRPIKTFDVTLLGLLVWFVKSTNDNKKSNHQIMKNKIRKIFPIISEKWGVLTKYFDETHMIKIFSKIFSNMEILHDDDPLLLKYKTFYRGVIMELKNVQYHDVKNLKNKLTFTNTNQFKAGFEAMVNFAFFLELYKLYDEDRHYDYDEFVGFKKKSNIKDWLKIVNSNETLREHVLTGFKTMKTFAKSTHEGINLDMENIIGSNKNFCDICGRTYEKNKEEEHFELHYLDKQNKKSQGIDYNRKKLYDRYNLLSRTEYEYELEFKRNKVFRFDQIFKF